MKIGDKVICINNDNGDGNPIKDLIMYNEYIILDIVESFTNTYICPHKCRITSAKSTDKKYYFCNRFIEIKSYRKLKLEKIYENR
jgi:hypothetical protein